RHSSKRRSKPDEAQVFQKISSRVAAALQLKGNHAAADSAHRFTNDFVLRMGLQARIVNVLHCRILFQILRDGESVGACALDSQGKCLDSAHAQPCIEWAER